MSRVAEYTSNNAGTFARPSNWTEILEPALFNFEKFGDTLEGMLLEMRIEKIKEDDVVTCRLETSQGAQVKFRPSFDLRQKLGRRLIGRRMLIVYDRDNQDTVAKGNAMKMFRVFVAPEAAAGEAPFVATENDLPENL